MEGAIEAGIKRVILPKQNVDDLVLSEDKKDKIEIIPVENISEVLKHVLLPAYQSLADRFLELNSEVIKRENRFIPTNPATGTPSPTSFTNPSKGL